MIKRIPVGLILKHCCLFACAIVLFILIYCFAWAQGFFSTSTDTTALNSAIHPWQTMTVFSEYFRWSGNFFNIPLLAIGVWLAWVFAITGNGIIIAHQLLPNKTNPLELLAFGFACGFVDYGLMIFALFALGFSGAKIFGILLTLQLIVTVGTSSFLYERLYLRSWDKLKTMVRFPREWPLRLLLITVVLLLLAGFLYCLTPPIQSDAMRYHLTAPQEFLKANSIQSIPLNAFTQFPLLLQMHYGLALALGVPEATHLMHWTCMLITAIAIGSFVSRFIITDAKHLPGGLSFLAFALYLATPAVYIVGCWPFTDQATVMFLVLTGYSLVMLEHHLFPAYIVIKQKQIAMRNHTNPDSDDLYNGLQHFRLGGIACITGIMIGGAIGTKYTAVPFILGTLILFVAHSTLFRRDKVGFNLLRAVVPTIFIASIGTGVWWYLRNQLQTRNPFYPLLNNLFGGGDWTPDNALFYAERMASKGFPKTLANLFTAPWDCNFNWLMYEAHYPGAVFLIVFALAIIAGAILLFSYALIRCGRSTTAKYFRHLFLIPTYMKSFSLSFIFLLGLFWWVMWFFSYQSNRLSAPTYAFFIPLAMMMVTLCYKHTKRGIYQLFLWSITLGAIYSMSWTIQWMAVEAKPVPPAKYLLGCISRDEYMSRSLSYWQAFDYLNKRSDENTKVFVIGDHRLYGAQFAAFWSDWFNTPAPAYYMRANKIDTVDAFYQHLRDNHFDWVMINDIELKLQGKTYTERLSDNEWKMILDFPTYAQSQGATVVPIQQKVRLIHISDEGTTTAQTPTQGGANE
ncbi:MAG: hypothetical protein PHX74_04080 [Candidatus Sumerlaeales bacterium]|nr:hypothetical protein [Candidatus Sumerlaeales bacterium]